VLADLDRVGLLPHGRRAAVERLQARYPAPRDLAAALARRGWLTSLQARLLARGRVPLVGPYLLVRKLARGGMGDVYLARHRHLGREAAVKTVRVTRDTSRGRFLRECEALGRLDHPRVAHAFDAGQDGRVLWLALEYVSGPDLAQVAVGGRLTAGLACRYARQAADGLAHVHARGLVHRDVKPGNLILDRGGGGRRCWTSGFPARSGRRAGT
jgi:serine/threonine protein kinase